MKTARINQRPLYYGVKTAKKCSRRLCFQKPAADSIFCADHQLRRTVRGVVPRLAHTTKVVEDNGGKTW